MSSKSIRAEDVRDVIVKTLRVHRDRVTEDARLVEDLKADSLDVIELVMALEDRFDVAITDDALYVIKTVGDAVGAIEAAQTAKAAAKIEQVAL